MNKRKLVSTQKSSTKFSFCYSYREFCKIYTTVVNTTVTITMAEFARTGRLPPHLNLVISHLRQKGNSVGNICKILERDYNFKTSRNAVWKRLKGASNRDNEQQTINNLNSSNRKVKPIHRHIIDGMLKENPETTSRVIRDKLKTKLGLEVSTGIIRQVRKQLGWTAKQTAYCQLISHKNKVARLEWCLDAFGKKESFHDVIFVDETTVELSSNGRLQFYKTNNPSLQRLPCKQPKPKHSYKVHVWGGISYRGRTHICVFTGIMDSVIYQQILQRNLLPFAADVFPNGFRLYQDNDSKHKSHSTKRWMEQVNILQNVMETPASSPDLNPIENVWSSLKYFLQTTIKPKTKAELVNGISTFWSGLSATECAKYIDHIHRVIPQVILNNGEPTIF